MPKIFVIARVTFREIIKSKILFNVMILGLAQLLLSFVAYSFTYGVPERVALDFGLGTLALSSVGIAIFMGVGLLAKEIENRTIYMVLTRPVGRSSFMMGRVLGMISVLILNIAILGSMTIGLYLLLGGRWDHLILWCLTFSIVEAILCLLLVVFFSLFTNTVMAVVYTLTTYVLGHAISDAFHISYVQRNPLIKGVLKGYSLIFPNFSKLNIKDYMLHQQMLSPEFLWGALVYGSLYCLALVFASSLIFEKKNLD